MTDDPLLPFRSAFPILERTNYLISNSLGAMPERTRDELVHYANTWATRGVRAWGEGWWEMALEVGDLLAPILGVGTGEVCMHQNVTIASSPCFILAAVSLSPGASPTVPSSETNPVYL